MKAMTLSKITRTIMATGHGYRLANWLIGRYVAGFEPEVTATVLGLTMRLKPREWVDQELLFYPNECEPAEISFIRATLKPGNVFVDIGAHIGFHSLIAASVVGSSGVVVAAEADPATFQRLLANIQLNRVENIKAYNVGIADKSGILKLFRYDGNVSSNSFIVTKQPKYLVSDTVDVKCATLLELLSDENAPRVDFLKIDIECFEYRVLRRFLAEAPSKLIPGLIMLEHHPQYETQSGGSPLALLEADGRYRELPIPGMVPRNHVFERR
jgi:FkbM family methyltransferase